MLTRRADDRCVEHTPDEDVADAAVGEFLEPARLGAYGDGGRIDGRFRIAVFKVLADDARVRDRDLVVAKHWNAAQGRERGELVVAEEGRDRIDLDLDVLQRADRKYLADVG